MARNGKNQGARGGKARPTWRHEPRIHGHIHETSGEDPAAGMIDSPVAPDVAQAGDRAEEAARRTGPVDVTVVPERGGLGG